MTTVWQHELSVKNHPRQIPASIVSEIVDRFVEDVTTVDRIILSVVSGTCMGNTNFPTFSAQLADQSFLRNLKGNGNEVDRILRLVRKKYTAVPGKDQVGSWTRYQ